MKHARILIYGDATPEVLRAIEDRLIFVNWSSDSTNFTSKVYILPEPRQWAKDGKPWIVSDQEARTYDVFDTQDEAAQFITDNPGPEYDLTGPPADW